VTLLAFNADRPAFRDLEARRFLASVVDRAALVDAAENGFADPVDTLFAFGVSGWPVRPAAVPVADPGPAPASLTGAEPVLLVSEDPRSLLCGTALARQLGRHGVTLRIETNTSGSVGWDRVNRRDYDLYLTRTWGAPYDPHTSLIARFTPAPERPTAVETIPIHADPELTRLVEASFDHPSGSEGRRAIYPQAQAHLDREVAVVPLYAARRIALTSDRVEGFRFGPNGYGLDLSELQASPSGAGARDR
jgi:nickel transport system substrate-binding protein